MERSNELSKRLNEVLLNGFWIANTNYKAELEAINWKQATQKIGSLNTIAALVFHINYYLAGILHVFRTGKLEISDKYSFDMPPLKSETDWFKLKNEFLLNSEMFVNEVSKLTDTKLNETFVDAQYGSYLRNIEGVIEHSYYHLGQISIMKKLIE